MAAPSLADDRPPRLGRRLLLRFALGGALIVLLTAGAVASAGLLEVKTLVDIVRNEGHPIPGVSSVLDDVSAGGPQTMLVLGSDKRFDPNDRANPGRSDTMLLIRLDPSKAATAVLSIPRDLKVQIPAPRGGIISDKINAAFALGGPKLAVQTVKSLLHIPINHVVSVNFLSFEKAVNRLGCVYVDVDRRYFNDNHPPAGGGTPYAAIDIQPGYQKLCGEDSLSYVRYRHFDDDFVRAARQQDFLRQAKQQIGFGRIFSDVHGLVRLFAQYTDTDVRSESATLRLLKLVFESSGHPIREVRFRGVPGPTYVTITPSNLAIVKRQFLQAQASKGGRETSAGTRAQTHSKRARRRSPGLPQGVIADARSGEDAAVPAASKLAFPVYFPAVRIALGHYVPGATRAYDIYDGDHHRHRAYRVVIGQGLQGQYYGVEGTTWKDPPILKGSHDTIRMRHRTYELYYDGSRLRLVAWKTPRAVYWVSNSLSDSLTNAQMLAVARSLQRVGSAG